MKINFPPFSKFFFSNYMRNNINRHKLIKYCWKIIDETLNTASIKMEKLKISTFKEHISALASNNFALTIYYSLNSIKFVEYF